MAKRLTVALALLVLVISFSTATYAGQGTVLRVVVVQTDNLSGYAAEIEKGKDLLKKAGSTGTIRVWQARWAGHEAGSVVVSIEYPSMTALAEDEQRMKNNAEVAAWLKGLDKFRKIVSDSIYYEH